MNEKFAICRDIHREFMANPDYEAFHAPVKWKEMGLFDYPTVIKQPMDLGTIERKLSREMYTTPAEYIYDMRLVYRNCMTYNLETSLLYEQGRKFMTAFEQRVRDTHLFDFDFHVSPQKSEKHIAQFKTALSKCNFKAVDAVFRVLCEVCPECLEQVAFARGSDEA
ncbi:hypothetical protein WA556_000251 [Blastocystis sp. ATCC 50177/Nand II]